MGHSKRHQKTVNAYPMRNTRNRTRLHNAKLFTDPVTSTLQLTNQLRSLGLYAAPTLGDGNCLFRALADQLWGSPNGHLTLRHDVCDWMEKHKERYEGFVDEDRTFEQHIRCMRVPGTYGGHLELSAFAHLKRRNVKVIQPGLVYVIEWNCGWVGDDDVGEGASTSKVEQHDVEGNNDEEAELNDREKRRLRREKKKLERNKAQAAKEPSKDLAGELLEELGAVYVAYHDWEHFSSIRNLTGPHTGLPIVVERAERQGRSYEVDGAPPVPARAKSAVKPESKAKGKGKGKEKVEPPLASITTTIAPPHDQTPPSDKFTLDDTLLMPTQIPLPLSRSTSPTCSSSLSPPSSFHTSALSASGRSPKRTFDESEESAGRTSTSAVGFGSSNKKHKKGSTTVIAMEVDKENDEEEDVEKTPSLSDDDASSSSHSDSSLSSIPSSPEPESTPPPLLITFTQPTPNKRRQTSKPTPAAAPPPDKPLTRRQRKTLGLPHPRTLQIQEEERSAGKIRIPGGRRGRSAGMAAGVSVVGSGEGEDEGEWARNGTGRVDVRGFRELKI